VNEKDNKFYFIAVLVAFVFVCAIGGVAVCGYLRTNRQVSGEPAGAVGINNQITDSLRDGLDRNTEAVEIVEEFRRRNKETDRAIRKLGESVDGSGDLLQVLRKKVTVLEDYFRDTGAIIRRSSYNGGGE
jgi:hypothetical protein